VRESEARRDGVHAPRRAPPASRGSGSTSGPAGGCTARRGRSRARPAAQRQPRWARPPTVRSHGRFRDGATDSVVTGAGIARLKGDAPRQCIWPNPKFTGRTRSAREAAVESRAAESAQSRRATIWKAVSGCAHHYSLVVSTAWDVPNGRQLQRLGQRCHSTAATAVSQKILQ
jgi:hypothetical protein